MKASRFDTLLSRFDWVRRGGADHRRDRHVADVPTINDPGETPFRGQRRQFLARHGPGLLCALVALIVPPIAAVVLIGCVVAFARHEGDDGRGT